MSGELFHVEPVLVDTTPKHRIHWTLEPESVVGEFICDDPLGDCHWYCDVGCEEVCIGYNDGTEHPKKHSRSCNYAVWIDNWDGATYHYNGPSSTPHDGPVEFEWDGDTWLWHYAKETH